MKLDKSNKKIELPRLLYYCDGELIRNIWKEILPPMPEADAIYYIKKEEEMKEQPDWEIACDTCEYLKECEKHNGSKDDVEGCRALAGTHFCKLSWKPFFEYCDSKKEEVRNDNKK